jgi:hypothetical protein
MLAQPLNVMTEPTPSANKVRFTDSIRMGAPFRFKGWIRHMPPRMRTCFVRNRRRQKLDAGPGAGGVDTATHPHALDTQVGHDARSGRRNEFLQKQER